MISSFFRWPYWLGGLPRRIPDYEKNLSAKQSQACAYTRLSCPHEDQVRARHHQCAACQGSQTPVRLSAVTTGVVSEEARFDRARRLTTATEFKRVFDQARRSTDNLLLVLARDNGLQQPRLGMAIARSKIPRASARNRVKRIIRESFRRHQQVLKGLDLVVLARTNLTHVDNQALFQSLAAHWQRQQQLKPGRQAPEQAQDKPSN